jgi:hypothetical protein
VEHHRLRQHPEHRRLLTVHLAKEFTHMGFILSLQAQNIDREGEERAQSVASQSLCWSTLSILIC